MKKNNLTQVCCVWLLFVYTLTGCVSAGTTATVTSGQEGSSIGEAQSEVYNGPKARIAVSQFKDKTGGAWYNHQIGDGMADQLVTALFNTNRFIVLERQTLDNVLGEQDLGATGRIKGETAAAIGEIEGAELLVVGSVTEFEGNASGMGGGAGGGVTGLLGAVMGGFKKAHMAIDIRVIDARTSRILAATSVEGEATDVNLGGMLAGYGGAGALAGGLSGWKNTPTEKALRICLNKAVDFIASRTPQQYYHIGGNAPAQASPLPAQAFAPPAPSNYSSGGGSDIVLVEPETLNVRSGPGTNYAVTFSIGGGEKLTVLERVDKWLRVRTSGGQEGWAAEWLTTPAR